MTLVRRVARPLLAAIFVAGGLDQFKHPGAKAQTAGPLLSKVGPRVGLPDDPELLIRANGMAMVGAGARAVLLYLIQRGDCDRFEIAADIDPAYAAAAATARAAGVEMLAVHADVTPRGIEIRSDF